MMTTLSAVVIVAVVMATTRAQLQKPEHFKIGFLAPWNGSYDDFSALTSASAISIAIERINNDPSLNKSMRFRSVNLVHAVSATLNVVVCTLLYSVTSMSSHFICLLSALS